MRETLVSVATSLMVLMIPSYVSPNDEAAPCEPRDVAAAYLAALQESNLDGAGRLFARVSSIFESGGVEGPWQSYREHHLGPEITAVESFSIVESDPEVVRSEDGSLALVAWPIEYTIVLKDERTIRSRGTVTFVLVREADAYKIRHLHWSSHRLSG